MNKKSSISSVFIYVISSLVIVIILYFGYKGISGIYSARQESLLETTKMQIKADFSQIALRFNNEANFEYQLPSKFSKLCFLDLFVLEENRTLRDKELMNYPLIADSVTYNLTNNAFFVGDTIVPFDVGKIRVSCPPFFVCFEAKSGKIKFRVRGKGTYVLIANETNFCYS
ncbi:MAG: hypothetical protein QXG86_00415 [Candidatus Woesearchaeota archaeon]